MLSKIAKTTLAAAAIAGSVMLVPGTASAAPASPDINSVPCGNSQFLEVYWHADNNPVQSNETCLANRGTWDFSCFSTCWLDKLSTGNNRVEYFGDGRWNPSSPIGKNTIYTFPHFPGGVEMDSVQIF
ncbi:MAG TPA: beta/gamma crystallin domain-containing protein [Pseudonocardiaceae bacterium]|nr:beta/gamma crystallin domain-containing protein [Pseudonocardiaceae bacterium]